MANNIIAGAKMYTSAIKRFPYMYSMYIQALADIRKFKYSQFGEETLVREIVGETAGTYGSAWSSNGVDMAVWSSFKAIFDREIAFNVDAVAEMDSILSGMELTGVEKMKASWRRLGPEIDAVACSTISSNIPASNKHSNAEAGYQTDVDHIIPTLIRLRQEAYDLGVWGDINVMIDTEVYGNLTNAFVNKNGLASGVMLKQVKSHLATAPADFYEDNLEFVGSIAKFMDNMYLYPVPAQCMNSQVLLLDKKSPGQLQGGWTPDTQHPNFYKVKIQIIPDEAAAISARHLVSNIAVPARFMSEVGESIQTELSQINQMYEGVAKVDNIGITQNGDSFWYQNRIKYGVAVFETQKHTMFEIYDANSVVTTITSIIPSANVLDPTGGNILVTITGTNLHDNMGIQVFDNTTAIGQIVATSGSTNAQVGVVAIPSNSTLVDKTYTVKVTADGSTFDEETVSIVVKGLVPAYTDLTVDVETLTAAGGEVELTITGVNLVDGQKIAVFEGSATTSTAVLTTSGTSTAQVATYTVTANESTENDVVWTFKASTDYGITYSDELKVEVTVAKANE